MTELYPEFYNDVFGPLMQPGSSSHMAAPCRAGLLCRALLGEDAADILVEMDPEGSFAGAFGQMNEDLGMLNGALGRAPDHPDFFAAKETLQQKGVSYRFAFCPMKESDHINALKFILTGVSGKKATLVANSIGGGMVETVWVNGYAFSGKGDTYALYVFDPNNALDGAELTAKVAACQPILESGAGEGQKGGRMHWFKLESAPNPSLIQSLTGLDIAMTPPILPVPTTAAKKPQLFDTMAIWRRLAQEQGKTLAEVAIDYEMAASGWDRQQVVAFMRDKIQPAMHRRTHALYEENAKPLCTPFTELHYQKWDAALPRLPLNMGVISKSIRYVTAGQPPVAGVLNVPGPMGTGGGFLYGVLSAVQEELRLSDEAVLQGLFVAAGVGAICYTRTNPTGEVIGCAGECGCCAAMAAAALVQMLGGSPEQAEAAASMTLQAAVGWPCDPIPGGKDMPCMSRVLCIASMPIVFAQWALAGQDPVLPFHEAVDVADQVGRSLSGDLLCTARGGHCAAPAARCAAAAFRQWRRDGAAAK